MSDEIIVFNREGAEQYKKIAREVARRMQNETPHRARWQQQKGGGGSGAQIINFQIVSSDPTTRSAQVQIEQRAFKGTVFGSSLIDTVVQVYDTDGCYLNEPNIELTARRGKAVLMYSDDASDALHFPGDPDPPAQYWCVLSICCPQLVCE